MPRYVQSAHAPAAPRRAKPMAGAAPARPRQMGPTKQPGAIWHAIQLRAARAAAPPPGPANRSGLPVALKAGVERLSGLAMDDVSVHRNSAEPARLGALAFAKGSDIHLGPGQEQHLPHEAWHVVQQKQGRVRPTLQMKSGAAVNDEQALESEADAMGAKALAGGAAPSGRGAGAPAAAPPHDVIQAKLRFKGVVQEDKNLAANPVPQRLLTYHQAPTIYEIRHDWDGDFKKTLHLLSTAHVYLLGEFHDKSKWDEQVKPWADIPKMQEYLKSFPGFEEEDPDPQKQPLESMHAFLLHVSLIARSQLLQLEASKTPAAVVDEFLWAVGQILDAKAFYDVLGQAVTEDDAAEKQFLDALRKRHLNAVDIARFLAAKLKTDLAVKNPNAETLNSIKELKPLLAGEADTFSLLATDLAKVIGIAPASEQGKAIAAEAKSKVAVAHAASAAMGVREEAMAKNINAAGPPLLVKVGDGHVENLGKLVKNPFKIRADKTLSDYTKI